MDFHSIKFRFMVPIVCMCVWLCLTSSASYVTLSPSLSLSLSGYESHWKQNEIQINILAVTRHIIMLYLPFQPASSLATTDARPHVLHNATFIQQLIIKAPQSCSIWNNHELQSIATWHRQFWCFPKAQAPFSHMGATALCQRLQNKWKKRRWLWNMVCWT